MSLVDIELELIMRDLVEVVRIFSKIAYMIDKVFLHDKSEMDVS